MWVLRRVYAIDRRGLLRVLDALSEHAHIVLEHADLVRSTINAARHGRADFADRLLGEIAHAAAESIAPQLTANPRASRLPGLGSRNPSSRWTTRPARSPANAR